jgi:alpha-D-xyloside xylohydrolase
VRSDFESLRRQIPAGLNYSLSGLPYWTTDTGGFVSGDTDDPAYRELFVRWFEFSTFTPILRVHGTRTGGNELWSYGPAAQKILAAYDRLRYRLLPYIYSIAWMTTGEGYTPMRGLVMDFPADRRTRDIGDEYMFGPAFLVAPVTEPSATDRRLYVPPGRWFDFHTGTMTGGGRSITAASPLDRMPLYVRGGSIVPLGPAVEWADERPADTMEIRVYAGSDCTFTLYDGESYDYEKGAYSVIPFAWNERDRRLTIADRAGIFPGMIDRRIFRVVFVTAGHGTGGDWTPHPDAVVRYTGTRVTLTHH